MRMYVYVYGVYAQPFGEVASLAAGGKSSVNLYIDFAGNTRPAKFDILTDKGNLPAFSCTLVASNS
jgi:hypothetical protein